VTEDIWSWSYAWEVLPTLLDGLVVTLEATALGFGFALVGGLVLAVLRQPGRRPARWSAGWFLERGAYWFVEFVRSTPLLVQLYFVFYVFPEAGVVLSPLTAGVLGLGLHYSAYLAEVYRSGIEGVPRGQWEAATALNLTRAQAFRRIVLPQAIPPVVPALGNRLIAIFKDTPLLAVITVTELLRQAKLLGAERFRYLEPMTLVGVIFLVLSLISSRLVSRVERWSEQRA
jgi:polar amino acid transport system permease protein